MKIVKEFKVTANFLNENPNFIFVFGDNKDRVGTGGAAVLRYHPQSYGFITKRSPNMRPESFYDPDDYEDIFDDELVKLINLIDRKPDHTFFVSKLGSGLANKFNIFQTIIEPRIKRYLSGYNNVILLWE